MGACNREGREATHRERPIRGGGLGRQRQPVGSGSSLAGSSEGHVEGLQLLPGRQAGRQGGERTLTPQPTPPQGYGACGGKRTEESGDPSAEGFFLSSGVVHPFVALPGTRRQPPIPSRPRRYLRQLRDGHTRGVPQLRPTAVPPLLLLLLLLGLLARPPLRLRAAPPPARPPGLGPTRK